MEETTLALIRRGCELARGLESSLPNLSDQPNMLSRSCDEIIQVFQTAKERLSAQDPSTAHPGSIMIFRELQESSTLSGWISTPSYTKDMFPMKSQAEKRTFDMQESGSNVLVAGLGGGDQVEGSAGPRSIGRELQRLEASDSGNIGSISSQRQRRRKDDGERRTFKMAAPRIGNTEIPPEDGFTWRKYGQKEILGSRFPRGYYRCTHQKLYQCPAKKQVQRLDDDPYTFEVTYRGDHTCHMSSTAPSIPPPPPGAAEMNQEMAQLISAQPPPSSVPLSSWLSMDHNFNVLGSAGGDRSIASGIVIGGTGGAGPSATRSGKEIEYPVADMADAMFNSGSSSTNSMDFIFTTCAEDKWEPGDKPS